MINLLDCFIFYLLILFYFKVTKNKQNINNKKTIHYHASLEHNPIKVNPLT
jgi:hypothetical protein